MAKFLLSCFAISCFSALSLLAQPTSVPSIPERPSAEFLKKLGNYVTLNQKEQSLKTFKSFEAKFKGGGFSERESPRVMAVCDTMLTMRLNAIPYFTDFLKALTEVESGGIGTGLASPFDNWMSVVEPLLAEAYQTRKSDVFRQFLGFSADFFDKNALYYGENAINWFAYGGRDYVWKFEKGTPSVSWEKLTIRAVYKKDSIEIRDTKGEFFPTTKQWRGKGAVVTWSRFKNNEIVCAIDDYLIDVSKGFYKAEKAKLKYPALFPNREIEGVFEDKVNFGTGAAENTYPRFESYDKRLKVGNIGRNIQYEGGFRLNGMTVFGYGTKEQKAILTINDKREGKRAFRATSELYVIRKDESIASESSEAVLYFGKDSIYHPSVYLRMDMTNNVLSLDRGQRASQRNPFYNSYHQVNMEMSKIKWFVDKDSLILGDKNPGYGVNNNNALFESLKFFSEPDFRKFQNIATRNPIVVLKMYSDQLGGKKILNADDAMRQINPKMDAAMVQSLLYDFVSQGFVNYDSEKNILELKDKVFHYSLANQKKVDYDVLRISSETTKENSNFFLLDTTIRINGVKGIELSNKQKVRVIPRLEEIVLKKNRDFDFDGRINAGFALFHGRKYHFNYDRFDIAMDSVRFMDLYLKTGEDAYKRPIATALNSRIEHVKGVLLIDAPNNKSGREEVKMMPSFQGKDYSYVFYDAPETQDSIYKRDSFYFKLDKFNLDGLDSLTREQLNFKGTMVSSSIFPDFRETLVLQPDSSLGFITRTPTEGYPIYKGKGGFLGEMTLNNKGFFGKGTVRYLEATVESQDVVFRPKDMSASAKSFFLKENRNLNVPQVAAPGVNINWNPFRDSMYLTSGKDTSFKIFPEGNYTMKNTIILTPSGVKGIGTFEWEKGYLKSKQFSFGAHSIEGDTISLSIRALNQTLSDQLALDTRNVRGKIDFDKERGKFKSNADDVMTAMPGIKYKTTINEFEWDLKNEYIEFLAEGKPAYFLSYDRDQDSLYFYGRKAAYDLKSNVLKVGGVEYIKTCDAYIYPNNEKAQIEFGGKMTTLDSARIVCDTITKHHVINRATVNIKGKKEYTATGYYEYNVAGKQQEIKFDNIIGQRVGPGMRWQKRTETQATGTVNQEDEFKIDHKTTFKGTISLFSGSKNLTFDGFAKLEHENLPEHQWFSIKSSADKADLALKYNVPKNEAGEPLYTGIFVSRENAAMYPRVMMPLTFSKDRPILDVKGIFKYNQTNDQLIFGDSFKVLNNALAWQGNKLIYDNRTGAVNAEGKFQFCSMMTQVKLTAAGTVRTKFLPPSEEQRDSTGVKSAPLSIEAMAGMQMYIPEKLLKIMAADVQAGSFDAPDTDYKKDDFSEKALAEFIFDEKEYRKVVTEMKEKTLSMPDKYNKFSFLFSRIPMRWNQELQSCVSYGSKADLNSIAGININKKITAWIEFKMPSNNNDCIYVYIKTANDFFYFFGFSKGILSLTSNNPKMEEEFNKIKPKERNIKADDGTVIEMQWDDVARGEMFARRVQNAQGK
jgi:hypothetical protein